jgi:hypothetical protein
MDLVRRDNGEERRGKRGSGENGSRSGKIRVGYFSSDQQLEHKVLSVEIFRIGGKVDFLVEKFLNRSLRIFQLCVFLNRSHQVRSTAEVPSFS